jgi:dienelactone hydrolase
MSDGEYVSLGYWEKDDLAKVIEYLRTCDEVSAIGLWGRSMGAVTALLHADRDPSIGAMVLDSPFHDLGYLLRELATSKYVAISIPSFFLEAAIAIVGNVIASKVGFQIDDLKPIDHVDATFVPALFVGGEDDDFIHPHHTRKLYEKYAGDAELKIVPGDHNTPRPLGLLRAIGMFFCRAFRCDDVLLQHTSGLYDIFEPDFESQSDARALQARRAALSHPTFQSMRLLQRVHLPEEPSLLEGALQLSGEAEAGLCIAGTSGDVYFLVVSVYGISICRASPDGSLNDLAFSPQEVELFVPLLVVVEVRPTEITLRAGTATITAEDLRPLGESTAWMMCLREGPACYQLVRKPLPSRRHGLSVFEEPRFESGAGGAGDGENADFFATPRPTSPPRPGSEPANRCRT